MKHVVRLAAVGCVSVLVAGSWHRARAGDAPPAASAGQARLTDADRAFFGWWDAKGFPDVTTLPFVTLDEPEEGGIVGNDSKEAATFPAGAFLLADDGKQVTLFLTDLHTVKRPLRSALSKEAKEMAPLWERGVEYRKADLAAWVRQGLDLLSKEGPDIPWYSKSDPFRAHRWSIPNQAFRIAVLARALAARGEESLARTMCDRALHEATRPAMTQQFGDDDPHSRASYDSIQAAIEREVLDVLKDQFADPERSWEDLLAAHEAWAKAFSPDSLTEADGSVAILRAMVAQGRARKVNPPKPTDPPSPSDRLATLIRDLQDVSRHLGSWDYVTREPDERPGPRPADAELVAMGFDAVPALIDALDDVRFTRTLEHYHSFKGQYRSSFKVLRAGELAWLILDRISSGVLRATKVGGPPTSGRLTRRRAAAAWFAAVKARGEQAILIDQVTTGTRDSRAAADRLVTLDAEAAVKALETGILAGNERSGRGHLVSVLAELESPSAIAAMLRLLEPLRGSDEGVTVASSLWHQGRREGLDTLIRWWNEAGTAPIDRSLFGRRFDGRILIATLVRTEHPDAISALVAAIAERSASDRIEIVRAFEPRPKREGKEPDGVAMKSDVEARIESLLAERLADGERAHGLQMGFGSDTGSAGFGDQPVVGEMAAWTLAERYPERWKFDPRASAKDRAAARVALANRWRTAHGQPPLEETKLTITPLPPAQTRPLLQAWLDADDENARDVAALDLFGAGLGALPAVETARDALKADDPRREQLDVVVRRLACVTREVRWSEKGPKPNEALTVYVEAVKGQPMSGPWITGLWRQVAIETPEGATGIDLTFDRPDDGTGGVLTLELTTDRTPWGGGDGAWILAGDGLEHVDDDALEDADSWWHEVRGPQVDGRLDLPADRYLRMRWTIKRGRG